jgi:hypothetical protein
MARTVYRRRFRATRRVRIVLSVAAAAPPPPSAENEYVGFHRDVGRLMNR